MTGPGAQGGEEGGADTGDLPWQRVTRRSGLMLHAPAALRFDPDVLKAEFAALDAAVPPAARTHHGTGGGGGWTALALAGPPTGPGAGAGHGPEPLPALAHMPSARALLDRPGWSVRGMHLLRQAAGDCLAWHFDSQALHRTEMRLLVPIHAPAGAVTLIGHERVAYAEGQAWAGDFCFPHQVENPTGRDRVMLAVDVAVTPALTALFPPPLGAEAERRSALAEEAANLLLAWRASPPPRAVPVPVQKGLAAHAP